MCERASAPRERRSALVVRHDQFEEDSRGLDLLYEVEFNDPEWVSKRLKDDGEVTVSSGFTFEPADLLKALPRSAAPGSRSSDSA
jgi:hypothetical protein